jgi:hypothetical protein
MQEGRPSQVVLLFFAPSGATSKNYAAKVIIISQTSKKNGATFTGPAAVPKMKNKTPPFFLVKKLKQLIYDNYLSLL